MTPAVRHRLLFALLAVTVLAAVWPDAEETAAVPTRRLRADPTAAPALRSAAPQTDGAAKPVPGPQERFDGETAGADPFGVKSWLPPPPPAPPAAPVTAAAAAAPTAPPLPFTYAGRLEVEPGRWVIYLVRGDQTFAVSKGDVFDGVYKFDGVEDGSLLIQYQPLSVTQKLQLSTEN